MKPGESPEEALHREVLEETGMIFKEVSLLGSL
ncbi:MAG: NUDIX domain-containing protein [Verrucomicrobiales bacterium]